jgi:hypothetical protein
VPLITRASGGAGLTTYAAARPAGYPAAMAAGPPAMVGADFFLGLFLGPLVGVPLAHVEPVAENLRPRQELGRLADPSTARATRNWDNELTNHRTFWQSTKSP